MSMHERKVHAHYIYRILSKKVINFSAGSAAAEYEEKAVEISADAFRPGLVDINWQNFQAIERTIQQMTAVNIIRAKFHILRRTYLCAVL